MQHGDYICKLPHKPIPGIAAEALADGRKTLAGRAADYPVRTLVQHVAQAPLGKVLDWDVADRMVIEVGMDAY